MADESIMEEALFVETDVNSGKIHAYTDKPEKIVETSRGENAASKEEVNPNELSFASHYGLHANPPDLMGHHSSLQSSNALQNQFGQQILGNQQGVQWFYQPFFQCNDPSRSNRTTDNVTGLQPKHPNPSPSTDGLLVPQPPFDERNYPVKRATRGLPRRSPIPIICPLHIGSFWHRGNNRERGGYETSFMDA
ncbi:hypothetical protein KSP40_PGU016121 [Platanthera guangdongensis]|uniref:Uncharacterized protein n=1 Tax=Platanthera guangdongensis TaxID=2320717 RepID=A0ABR2MED9_9ASPA